ncbi:MAG: NADH-quinone oxidoreductase subunit J [Thermoplasmatales archaeon]|jgi:NADH-ubiquinone/plastoquinone oxidoreductase chain 6.
MIVFLVISAAIVGTALLSAISKNLLHSSLWLIFMVVSVAAMFFYLGNIFLSMVEVLVYAGAIMTLILTSVMLSRRYLDEE